MSSNQQHLHELASLADPAKLAHNLTRAYEQALLLAQTLSQTADQQKQDAESQILPIAQVTQTLSAITKAHLEDPKSLMDAQARLWAQYTMIWNNAWTRALGQISAPIIEPERADKRFKDKDWSDNSAYDALKQAYLVTSKWMQEMVRDAKGIDDHTKLKAKFYVENILNALAPSNFPTTNPQVLRETLASNGENILKGLQKLIEDYDTPDGRLRISQVDKSGFALGENIATTPGKVVFRNHLFELIQYSPQVARTFDIPLLIIPPWINKYYILDLTEKKSFVKFCVENGLTVFIVSWVNADESTGTLGFSDYTRDGFLAAVEAVQRATGSEKVNTVGFCIGGSLLASSLGYMAAKGDHRVNATTFLTTQVDFEKAGDLCVYVDEEQVKWIEERMKEHGYLPGSRMADAFNLLRSNDLIWSYVVNNYLLGKEPMPFDLLYWNSDSTRMPAGVHSFYLRECYLHNKLSKGRLVLDNVRVDLSKVTVPIYNLACRDDHIAPFESVFRLDKYFGGKTELVVSGSGHIAGVVNPPAANKYGYWTGGKSTISHEEWLKTADAHPGSWWTHWLDWIQARSGDKVTAPVPGGGDLPVICDAPGEYVRVSGVN